jgi:hypothetical protein
MIVVFAKKDGDDRLERTIELLSEIKENLKTSDIAKEICKKYGYDIDIIDGIPIEFKDDLGSSAKTINSKISISDELIDAPIEKIMRYAIHELVHALQHMQRYGKEDPYKDKKYLDRPDEIEAFQSQIEFEAKEVGMDEAEDYVDDLLDYHDIPENDKDDKKEELMNKVE